jgi:PEP-CTERM motif-containing protein
MMSRAFRPIAAILAILLLTGVHTQAAPVAISEVIQVLGSYQNPPELRLRSVSQSTNSLVDEGEGPSPVASASQESAASGAAEIPDTSVSGEITSDTTDTLLAGVAVTADPQAGVDVVDQGDVEGTICDCGEITVPGGGWPKWPLLFLAAIPLFFIHGCDHCETPPPTTPTPPPSTPEIPEPASLLLFGSGLAAFGAGLRRRYAKGKLQSQMQTTEEG